MTNKGKKLKRFNEEEKKILRDFVALRNEQKKPIVHSDTAHLRIDLSKVNGGIIRLSSGVWDGLKRFGGMGREAQSELGGEPVRIVQPNLAAARKIMSNIRGVTKAMGKPPEYLQPLEDVLASWQEEHLRLKELEKKNKLLQGFLMIAKKILKMTCVLRQQAVGITKMMEDLRKKDGTNLNAFLQDLEESELLREK